ncbi:MAG: hypothetical protein IT206_01850 [Fimbriimonadaceae bacterium]|nr:hypothetical protein [Fimbriimonadaceae bacterium]
MIDNNELISKLAREVPLSMAEAHELDQVLGASEVVASFVRQVPDEEPSLAWRSALNERLIAHHAPKRTTVRQWGMVGFGSAVAVAASIFFLTKPVPPKGGSLATSANAEQILLDAHRANVFALSTGAGDGSEPIQAKTVNADYQWTEADLGAF